MGGLWRVLACLRGALRSLRELQERLKKVVSEGIRGVPECLRIVSGVIRRIRRLWGHFNGVPGVSGDIRKSQDLDIC